MGYAFRLGKYYYAGQLNDDSYKNQNKKTKDIYFFAPDVRIYNQVFVNDTHSEFFRELEKELLRHHCFIHFREHKDFEALSKKWNRNARPPWGIIFFGKYRGRIVSLPELEGLLNPILGSKWFKLYYSKIVFITKRIKKQIKGIQYFSTSHLVTSVYSTLANWIIHNQYHKIGYCFGPKGSKDTLINTFRLKHKIEKLGKRSFSIKDFKIFIYDPERPDINNSKFDLRNYFNFRTDVYFINYYINSENAHNELLEYTSFKSNLPSLLRTSKDYDILIFEKDRDALAAKQWFQKKNFAFSPAFISLENNPKYISFGIKSVIIDYNTSAYLLAHAILGDIPIARSSKGFIEATARMCLRD